MKCPACGFKIVKQKPENNRSNPQNKYFHGVVLPLLSDHTGYTEDEMKAIVKWKFKVLSTSSLTTAEFMEFIGNIQHWAAEYLSLSIPDPKEDITPAASSNTEGVIPMASKLSGEQLTVQTIRGEL
jgi:hypothetical protein